MGSFLSLWVAGLGTDLLAALCLGCSHCTGGPGVAGMLGPGLDFHVVSVLLLFFCVCFFFHGCYLIIIVI